VHDESPLLAAAVSRLKPSAKEDESKQHAAAKPVAGAAKDCPSGRVDGGPFAVFSEA
jgi:hypothetical protein